MLPRGSLIHRSRSGQLLAAAAPLSGLACVRCTVCASMHLLAGGWGRRMQSARCGRGGAPGSCRCAGAAAATTGACMPARLGCRAAAGRSGPVSRAGCMVVMVGMLCGAMAVPVPAAATSLRGCRGACRARSRMRVVVRMHAARMRSAGAACAGAAAARLGVCVRQVLGPAGWGACRDAAPAQQRHAVEDDCERGAHVDGHGRPEAESAQRRQHQHSRLRAGEPEPMSAAGPAGRGPDGGRGAGKKPDAAVTVGPRAALDEGQGAGGPSAAQYSAAK